MSTDTVSTSAAAAVTLPAPVPCCWVASGSGAKLCSPKSSSCSPAACAACIASTSSSSAWRASSSLSTCWVWDRVTGKGQEGSCEPDTPFTHAKSELVTAGILLLLLPSVLLLDRPHLCVLILVVGALVGAPQLVTQAACLLLPLLFLILLVFVLTLLQLQLLLQVLRLLGNCGAAATSGQQHEAAEGELPALRCTVLCCRLGQLQTQPTAAAADSLCISTPQHQEMRALTLCVSSSPQQGLLQCILRVTLLLIIV